MNETKYGQWLALEELGRGGQGIVYRAIQEPDATAWTDDIIEGIKGAGAATYPHLRREAIEKMFLAIESRLQDRLQFGALKVLHEPVRRDAAYEKARRRSQQMLTVLQKVQHPNLVPLLQHSSDGTWMVFKFVRGGILDDQIGLFKGDPLAACTAWRDLVDAVAAMHDAGAIHRDIKPGNIFVGPHKNLLLSDLGLVYFEDAERSRVTDDFEKVGTTDYMPTWLISAGRVDEVKPSFDTFALGKILWALISGRRVLPLHYIERPDCDLRRLFPEDPSIVHIHERILKRTVVEHESHCLPNARALLSVTDDLLRVIRAERDNVCRCCGLGKYYGDVGATTGLSPRYVLRCKRCGHILEFEADDRYQLPDWIDALKEPLGPID